MHSVYIHVLLQYKLRSYTCVTTVYTLIIYMCCYSVTTVYTLIIYMCCYTPLVI